MNHSQEYHKFWIEHGQFMQPADKLQIDGPIISYVKDFGASMFEHFQNELQEEVSRANAAVNDTEHSEEAFKDFKQSLRDVLSGDTSNEDKIKNVLKICED